MLKKRGISFLNLLFVTLNTIKGHTLFYEKSEITWPSMTLEVIIQNQLLNEFSKALESRCFFVRCRRM